MLASSVGRVAVPENRRQFETFELRSITPHIGAEIRGLDLSKPMSDAQAIEFDQAFQEWMVLAIRDQELTRDQHKAFGRRFGRLHVHPMQAAKLRGSDPEILPVVTDANVAYTAGDGWHTDVTCDEIPPLASMLYMKETPECGGGDTSYADMYLAYELLSDTMKNFLEPLEAVHDGALPYVGAYKSTPPEGGYPRHRHPVIARHPETGRKVLYVNSGFTSHVVGLTPTESRSLLDMLFAHIATTLRLHCRVRWEPNTLTLWDNRCTQHHAVWDYYPYSRKGERVSVVDGKPPSR